MISINENNIAVDYNNADIIHIKFLTDVYLCTHLLRDLKVTSKAKNGFCAKAYIFSGLSQINVENSFWRACKKAERFSPGIIIAVVAPDFCKKIVAKNYQYMYRPTNPFRVFDNCAEALAWTAEKLNNAVLPATESADNDTERLMA